MITITEKLLNILNDGDKIKAVIAQPNGYILSIDTVINDDESAENKVSSFFRIKNNRLYIICAIGNGITFDSLIGTLEMEKLDDILNELSANHINGMKDMFINMF